MLSWIKAATATKVLRKFNKQANKIVLFPREFAKYLINDPGTYPRNVVIEFIYS